MTRGARRHRRSLRRAPMIDVTHLVHAADRAARRAALLRQKLTLYICGLIPSQRYSGIPALLAAVVHQPVLADVQIPPPRSTTPVVRLPIGDRLLKVIEPRVAPSCQIPHLGPHPALSLAKRLQLTAAIMDDPDRRTESQRQCTLTHRQSIVG